jgi:putative oxidoreductase
MELGIVSILLRAAIGPMLIAHGVNKVWGSGGLTGTTRWFEALGLRPAALHARLAALTEIGTGLALVAGLLTPFACASAVGLMVVAAITDHRGKGLFVFKGGWEYVVVVAIVSVALAAAGPGRWSVDRLLGTDDWNGATWAGGAATLGIVAALLLLVVCYRPVKGDTSST